MKNIGFGLLITCMSCAISKKENERLDKILSQQSTPSEIKFVDKPNADMLRNYEIRAIEKLEEFYDYFVMLSHDAYEESMKSEIRASALGLFYNVNERIHPLDPSLGEAKTVERCLMDQQETDENDVSVSSIEITTPLQISAAAHYEGQLSFQITLGKEGNQKIISKSAAFTLRKIKKTIGTESVLIWEVFLDRIE
jgi:hypothetical protein